MLAFKIVCSACAVLVLGLSDVCEGNNNTTTANPIVTTMAVNTTINVNATASGVTAGNASVSGNGISSVTVPVSTNGEITTQLNQQTTAITTKVLTTLIADVTTDDVTSTVNITTTDASSNAAPVQADEYVDPTMYIMIGTLGGIPALLVLILILKCLICPSNSSTETTKVQSISIKNEPDVEKQAQAPRMGYVET